MDVEQIKEWSDTCCDSSKTPQQRRDAFLNLIGAIQDANSARDQEEVQAIARAAREVAEARLRREVN